MSFGTYASVVVSVSLRESLSFVTEPTFTYSRTNPLFSTSAAAIKPSENNLLINLFAGSSPLTVKCTKSIPDLLGGIAAIFWKVP